MTSSLMKDAWYHTKETVLGFLILAVPLLIYIYVIEVVL